MAIFQPTNIVPSSFTEGTVDAVKDNMEVSWQVNGNSAMTAFQIDFYLNDTASTPVYSTGRTDNYSYTDPTTSKTISLPFYGTDRFGRPQFFTWNAEKSWAQQTMLETRPITNGNNYKFKITQWYEAKTNVVSTTPTSAIASGNTYYFALPTSGFVSFKASRNYATTDRFYYDTNQQKGWVVLSTNQQLIEVPMAYSTTTPTGTLQGNMTLNATASAEDFVVQTSDNTFITRDTPTLILYQTDSNYQHQVPLPSSFATSVGYFHADYQQAQNNPIRWIRWQVATATYNSETEKWIIGDILVDTDDIYTPTLNFEFNGFFNGNSYAIRCTGESESGQSCDTNWAIFTINVKDPQNYTGVLATRCLHKENATLLEWDGVTVITGKYNPPQDNDDEQYTFSNGSIQLPANSSVVWDKVMEESGAVVGMDFDAPWTAVWKGKCGVFNTTLRSYVGYNTRAMALSPDGKTLILGDEGNGATLINYPSIYTIDGVNANLAGRITINGQNFNSVSLAMFSPDGKTLILCGQSGSPNYRSGTFIYSVNGTDLTYVGELARNGEAVRDYYSVATFSPDGKILILGGASGITKYETSIYSVDGTNFTYVGSITDGIYGESEVTDVAFSPEGTIVAISKNGKVLRNGGVSIYSVNDTEVTYLSELTLPNYLSYPNTRSLSFSPDGKILATAGINGAFLHSVNDTNLTYIGELTKNGETLSPSQVITFSSDGRRLAVYTLHIGGVIFSMNGAEYEPLVTFPSLFTSDMMFSPDGNVLFSAGYDATIRTLTPQGQFFILATDNGDISLSITDFLLTASIDKEDILNYTLPNPITSVAVMITPSSVRVYEYNNGLISNIITQAFPTQFEQNILRGVTILGGETITETSEVSVYKGDDSTIINLYENPSFEPVWNAGDYVLYMTANFNGNLEAGTGSGSGTGFRVYRQEVGRNTLTPIATLPANITSLKDYGISSRRAYRYSIYAYDINESFMSSVEADNLIATSFKDYSLLVCDYDQDKDEYHVRKQYLFALNLSTGSVGNNNSPTLNANFTQYPTRMPSTQNYASGTLQGLIGAIYTVPALIEQIGQYKYTAKPSTLDYFDTVDLEKELYDLSTAPYQLFLRDMKGRLRMIATSGAISMTTNIKQKQQSISISFPWVEIGDASDVTIIQTPDDYGWNNDNQVLDVQLDVDVATGELSATYPFPYNGTKFYLTGVNQENLTAKTPLGITPAQFDLSEVAEEPNDGEVTATVKVNTENN